MKVKNALFALLGLSFVVVTIAGSTPVAAGMCSRYTTCDNAGATCRARKAAKLPAAADCEQLVRKCHATGEVEGIGGSCTIPVANRKG